MELCQIMSILQKYPLASSAALAIAVAAALSACGGGNGGSSSDSSVPTPAPMPKATVSTKVIDGPIQGAIVCLDKNSNGLCDPSEPQAMTDALGSVSFEVEAADVGKYPLVAYVGTDAVDTVIGKVTVPFLMSTPADATSVITPFTTIIQQMVVSSGVTTEQAMQSVQAETGITANLFVDPNTLGGSAPAIARMIVLTSQQATTAMVGAVGGTALDNTTITEQAVLRVSKSQTLALLPEIVAAVTSGQSDAALTQAASAVVSAANLGPDSAKLLVASQNAPVEKINSGIASNTLRRLDYKDSSNYSARFFTSTAAQATPDAQGQTFLIDRNIQVSNGVVSKFGGTTNTYFNGKIWRQCEINGPFSFKQSVLATGDSSAAYDFCDQYDVGSTSYSSLDVSGQSMLSVYQSAISAGSINLSVSNPAGAFGNAVFPAGSSYRHQTSTSTARAIYYRNNPSSRISESTRVRCTDPYTSRESTTIESLVGKSDASSCDFGGADSFTYAGVKYTEPGPNVWLQTLFVARIGSFPFGTGTAPGYYSGNSQIRVGFAGSGSQVVSYYQCKERFSDGNARACEKIQEGTYSIETKGDARVLIFKNLPVSASTNGYYTVPVERGGYVYFGTQSRPQTSLTGRFNTVATAAVAAQLGIPLEDPSAPLALTAGSYQGTYRLFDASGKYVRIGFSANGTVGCSNAPSATSTLVPSASCSFTINDPAFGSATTGKFTLVNKATNVAVTTVGTIDFMSGVINSTSSTDGASWSGYRQ
jgi:hypothetical protein